MTNLPFFHREVEAILRASEQPAETLFERYMTYDEQQREALVVALIGALVALSKRHR